MNDELFQGNLTALRGRYPELAARIDRFPGKEDLRVFPSQDGGVAYGIRRDGQLFPVSDPVAPNRRIQGQLDQYASQLQDFTRPILMVGLYPGNDLLYLFDFCEKVTTPHCPQPIWVCVDSLPCLHGFMSAWDVRRVVESPRVRFFWHEEVNAQVAWLMEHPEVPHVFTLVTGAAERVLAAVMPPFVKLVAEREAETKRLCEENNAYYDGLSDEELARRLEGRGQGGGARPRLMMPTVAWSTFVQHSTRDTCAAFEAMGWETRVLRMEAMLTPYHLVKSIHDFKPDVFLFIDHLRHEADALYPHHMMFVTWIQDEMKHLQCEEAGRRLTEFAVRGKRDLVVGYVEGLESKYGYPRERLVPLHVHADPRIFRPIELSADDHSRYDCEVAFMSNVSLPTQQVVERQILPAVETHGLGLAALMAIHDHLWKEYRAGRTFPGRESLRKELMGFKEFADFWNRIGETLECPVSRNGSGLSDAGQGGVPVRYSSLQEEVMILFYWRLNDAIYRHVVLEWLDEMGVDLHLHGQGWEHHPRFQKYAQGPLAHGLELCKAYQAAKFCLHLNVTQGMHQRVWEILMAGGHPLLRATIQTAGAEPEAAVMHRLVGHVLAGDSMAEWNPPKSQPGSAMAHANEAVTDWVFLIASAMAQEDAKKPETERPKEPLENRVASLVDTMLLSRPDWVIEDWPRAHFTDRAGLALLLGR